MNSLLNLGVSNPLTFGMAHPLTDRLERLTSVKVSKTKSRLATGLLLLTSVSLSAPFTIATEKVEKLSPLTVNLMYPKTQANSEMENFLELEPAIASPAYGSKTIDIVSQKEIPSNQAGLPNQSNEDEITTPLNVQNHMQGVRHNSDIETQNKNPVTHNPSLNLSVSLDSQKDEVGSEIKSAKKTGAWSFSVGDENQVSFSGDKAYFINPSVQGNSVSAIDSRGITGPVTDGSFVLNEYNLGYLYTMNQEKALSELAVVKKQKGLTANDIGKIKRALKDITENRRGVLIAEAPNPPFPPTPNSTYSSVPTVPTPPTEPAYIGKGMQFSNGKLISSDGPYSVIRNGEIKPMYEGKELTDTQSRILAAEAVLDSIDSLLDEVEDFRSLEADRREALDDMRDARREAIKAKLESEFEARQEFIEAKEEASQARDEARQEMQERVQDKIERAKERVRDKINDKQTWEDNK